MKTFLIGIIFVMAITLAAIFATPTKHTSHEATPTPVVATTYIGGDRDIEAANIVLYALLVVGTVMVGVVALLAHAQRKDKKSSHSHDEYEQEYDEARKSAISDRHRPPSGIPAPPRPKIGMDGTMNGIPVERAEVDRRFPYNSSSNKVKGSIEYINTLQEPFE